MDHFTCAFTGHRPQKFPWGFNDTDARCVALKDALDTQIIQLAASGVTDFFSGMALGVDQWATLSVLSLRKKNRAIKLHCILPCESQADKWEYEAMKLYQSILRQADSVVYVSKAYTPDCMLERNRYLVSHASIVLAVYNGEQRGGTAATVRYARKLGREIYILDPLTRGLTHIESAPRALD